MPSSMSPMTAAWTSPFRPESPHHQGRFTSPFGEDGDMALGAIAPGMSVGRDVVGHREWARIRYGTMEEGGVHCR